MPAARRSDRARRPDPPATNSPNDESNLDGEKADAMLVTNEMIAALIGALVGAAAAWMAGVYNGRWTRTLDMHREFNADRMSESRGKAFLFLKQHWGVPFAEIAARAELDAQAVPLWDVMRFYQRLSVTVRYGQVNRRIVPALFGEIFLWWYLLCYRQQLLQTKWVAAKDIEYLYWFMKKNVERADWDEWNERHEEELTRLRRQHRARPPREPDPPAGNRADAEIAANIAALERLISRAQGMLRTLEGLRHSR